jgi:hypothetical protein
VNPGSGKKIDDVGWISKADITGREPAQQESR